MLAHLRKHVFFYILLIAVVAIGLVSYYRFVVMHDYLVTYEGTCEPSEENCYVGCEDEECAEPYYYTIVEKYAADLYEQCGPDITECEAANICLPEEDSCTITYCDLETEGEFCEDVEYSDQVEEDSEDSEGDDEEASNIEAENSEETVETTPI